MTADDARTRAIEAVEALGVPEVWGAYAAAVVDAVEPFIRADEREQKMAAADIAFLDAVKSREELAEVRERLRVQVVEWRDYAEANERTGYMRDEHRVGQAYAYERVLDLLDGEPSDYPRDSREAEAIDALLDGTR